MFYFYYPPFSEYLMRECEKGYQIAWATVNTKIWIYNLQYLSHFWMDFYATNMSQSAVKRPFWWYIIHICRLYSFWGICEKPEVIDTYYPWYEGSVVYKKIYPTLYIPLSWVKYSLWWIIISCIFIVVYNYIHAWI